MRQFLVKITRFFNKKLFWLIYKLKPIYMFPFPNFVRIDASTHCNLKCISCPTGQGRKELSRGFLKFEDFKKFIDKYQYFIDRIDFSNYGEIFLNPEIFEIIKYAEDRNICTTADSNLNYFNEEMAQKLLETGMTKLTIALDGSSQETYSKYRKGGSFDAVISHVLLINKFKERFKTQKPKLIWQFVVSKYNEHEIDQAEAMARKLGMNFYLKSNWDPCLSPSNVARKDIHYPARFEFCNQLWNAPVINYNGNMLGCCVLFEEEYNFGNVFENGFFKVYNGSKMKKARKIFLKKIKNNSSIAAVYCFKCKERKNLTQNLH